MSNKADLQRKLTEIGYQIGLFASKDTLSNVIRLHSLALQNTGIDVAKLNDHDLRKNLTDIGLVVGPVTNYTRAIYQRKLLEVLTNETSEGKEDETEIDIPIAKTPPRTTRSSVTRDNEIPSSPVHLFSNESKEPRIALTRVDIDDRSKHGLSSYYSNLSSTKPKSEQTKTNSYSPQRLSTKAESRHSHISHGLRNPYDFQNDEPIIIRHEHKATPFRTTNISSSEMFSTDTNRYTKQSDPQSAGRNGLNSGKSINEIRSRIFTSRNQERNTTMNNDSTKKQTTLINQYEDKKWSNNEQPDVTAKNSGTYFYGSITIIVALIVFMFYIWFEN